MHNLVIGQIASSKPKVVKNAFDDFHDSFFSVQNKRRQEDDMGMMLLFWLLFKAIELKIMFDFMVYKKLSLSYGWLSLFCICQINNRTHS